MGLIAWGSGLRTRVDKIDQQHEVLVDLVNELHDALRTGRDQSAPALLSNLVLYTRMHFASEEELMRDHGYPGAEGHTADHRKLMEELVERQREFQAGNQQLSIAFVTSVSDWLIGHMGGADKDLGAYVNGAF